MIANKMEASQECMFFGGKKNNPGLSPDYQMVHSLHIEFLKSLGREIGKKLY